MEYVMRARTHAQLWRAPYDICRAVLCSKKVGILESAGSRYLPRPESFSMQTHY